MAKTKISTLAKELNLGLNTVVEFLNKKNIVVDSSPNTRVEKDIVDIVFNEFDKDHSIRNRLQREAAEAEAARRRVAEEAAARAEAEAKAQAEFVTASVLENGLEIALRHFGLID